MIKAQTKGLINIGKAKTLKATLVVTLIIALSKIVGFVRDMVSAYYFGQSTEISAYYAAYRIITVFVLLFSAGVSSAFIPQYTRIRINEGERKANSFSNTILTLYLIIGIICSILGYIYAPQISAIFWQGSKEGLEITSRLTRLMIPFISFNAITGVMVNVLNAREKFIPEQLMGFALSITTVIACMLFRSVEAFALATGIAAVIQFIMLLPFSRKVMRYKIRLKLKDPNVQQTFMLAFPALISMAFDELNHTIDGMIGSSISDAAIAAITNSYRLLATALGILVVPLTTVMFSKLSKYSASGNKSGIVNGLKKSSETLAFITLPIIAVCMSMSNEVIAVAYQRGSFTAVNTAFTAPVFALYMLGFFTFGLRNFQTRVFYSLQDTKTPTVIGIVSVIINIVLNIYFAKTMGLGVKGLTLATSIAGMFAAAIQLICLRVKLGRIRLASTITEFCKIGIASIFCFVATAITRSLLLELGTDFAGNFMRLALSTAAGLATYLLIILITRVKCISSLFSRR